MRSVSAAVAGLFLGGFLLFAVDAGWEAEVTMGRERLFLFAVQAVILGWILGLALCKLARSRALLPFAVGLLAVTAFGGPFLFGLGLALTAIALRPMQPAPWHRAFLPLAVLAHLAIPGILLAPADENPFGFDAQPALAAAPADRAPLTVGEAQPDVLLVVVDTLRADSILDSQVPTPHLDALRARGLWAEAALAPANQTLPSHLGLLMGLDIMKIGMRGNLSRWPTAEQLATEWRAKSLAARMGEFGYRTVAVSSNPLLDQVPPDKGYQGFDDGFDSWAPLKVKQPWKDYLAWVRERTLLGFATPPRWLSFPLGQLLMPNDLRNFREHVEEGGITTDRSIAFVEELAADDRPYFLLAQYFDPHTPYIAPAPFAGTVAKPEMAPGGFDGGYASDYAMRVQMRQAFRDEATTVESQRPIGEFQHALYLEEVAYFDREFGRLLEAVEATGRPTLIVFTSDHGETFGRQRAVEHGESLLDDEILVPLVIAGAGVEPGRLAGVPDLVDATRTILARVGADTAFVDGRDLLAADPGAPAPQLAVRISEVTIRGERWKLVARMDYFFPDPDDPEERPTEKNAAAGVYNLEPLRLIDLAADPLEDVNLLVDGTVANPEAGVALARLTMQLRARLDADFYPSIAARAFSAKEIEDLANLGYVGDSH